MDTGMTKRTVCLAGLRTAGHYGARVFGYSRHTAWEAQLGLPNAVWCACSVHAACMHVCLLHLCFCVLCVVF